MKTFEVTYTWTGTLDLEAEDEDGALEEARRELGQHRAPQELFDFDDETMEVTG
jgi:hypothetical protein|tara:strand:- start:1107 stop:1268 length:162 start_codon:yes stop_codon:yes gene_type:complete